MLTTPDAGLAELCTAAAEQARVLGVAGGDGTVRAAAQAAVAARLPLLVVPGGTLNHFAAGLGVHRLEDAVEALQAGTGCLVDLARATGDRCFLNTASVGGYPEMVLLRERLDAVADFELTKSTRLSVYRPRH